GWGVRNYWTLAGGGDTVAAKARRARRRAFGAMNWDARAVDGTLWDILGHLRCSDVRRGILAPRHGGTEVGGRGCQRAHVYRDGGCRVCVRMDAHGAAGAGVGRGFIFADCGPEG